MGAHAVYGYRTSFTDTSEAALDGFKNMLKCVADTKQDPSTDPLVKFWTEVVDLHDKATSSPSGAKNEEKEVSTSGSDAKKE